MYMYNFYFFYLLIYILLHTTNIKSNQNEYLKKKRKRVELRVRAMDHDYIKRDQIFPSNFSTVILAILPIFPPLPQTLLRFCHPLQHCSCSLFSSCRSISI